MTPELVWYAVIGLWAFLSLRCLLWLRGLVELYGVCTLGILNIISPSYRELILNECTVKLSSTPSEFAASCNLVSMVVQ